MSGTDFPPTTQQLEVHERLQGLLRDAQVEMKTIREQDIAALNSILVELGIGHVVSSGVER